MPTRFSALSNLDANRRRGSYFGVEMQVARGPKMSTVYPECLIRAIDDWQAGSRDKARKARRLKARSRHLPDAYRAVPKAVFRQVRVNYLLAIGIAIDATPEAISSWTTSEEVAMRFREDDQDRSKIMVIFRRRPAANDIILNLNTVYADAGFMKAVRATSQRLKHTF